MKEIHQRMHPIKGFSNTFSLLMNWILIFRLCWVFNSKHEIISCLPQLVHSEMEELKITWQIFEHIQLPKTFKHFTLTDLNKRQASMYLSGVLPLLKIQAMIFPGDGDNHYTPTSLRSLNWWIHRSIKCKIESFIPIVIFIIFDH